MMFIVDGSYAALPEWLSIIVKNSTGFYIPVFEEIYRYSWDMFKKHGQFIQQVYTDTLKHLVIN
jgi:hypothetical protein